MKVLLDRIGDWNPQLYRELKGRFKSRNLLLTGACSFLGQALLLMANYQEYSSAIGIDKIQWYTVFIILNWTLPFLLLVAGVYGLICDVAGEERKGSLNFIRLSPQSSQSILMGKMLGVPALLYLGVALAIPLHLGAGLAEGLPFFWLVRTYTLWGAGCGLFYSFALLYTLQHSARFESRALAGSGCLLTFLLAWPYIGLINSNSRLYSWSSHINAQWFFLPIGRQLAIGYGLTIISIGAATYWFWQALNRRFHNPNTTLLSKRQSYWLVASFQVWLLGFSLPGLSELSIPGVYALGAGLLFFLNPLFFIILLAALIPKRQELLDWTRYRRDRVALQQSFCHSSLIQDLIWSDRSPITVAIAINLLITFAIWLPWTILCLIHYNSPNFSPYQVWLAWLLTANCILIYAAIAELRIFLKNPGRILWISGIVGLIGLILMGQYWWGNGLFMLAIAFSTFPAILVGISSTPAIVVGLFAQLGILAFVSLQLTQQLRKAGASSTKALLEGFNSKNLSN